MPVDPQVFLSEPVHPMNPAICETSTILQTHRCVAAVGQISPAEGTLAMGQYSPLEGACVDTHQHTPRADPDPELPVQSTFNDLGKKSAFVLQIRVILNL